MQIGLESALVRLELHTSAADNEVVTTFDMGVITALCAAEMV